MSVIAHVFAVPVEELILAATGAGGGLALVRVWIAARLRPRGGAR